MMKEIIISILTYNNLNYTKKCLESLFKTPKYPNYKVVVSDNGSTDETVEFLKQHKDIEFINNKKNLGFSKAHNQILKMYPNNDIVLLNNDLELPFGWLPTIAHCVEKRQLGAASPAIKVSNGLDVGAVLNKQAKGRSLINENTKPDWITGSCLYITRDTINKVGYLDENFGFYYEDVDYCFRMRKEGIRFECIRDVVIIHYNSVSSTSQQKKIMMENSRRYFAKKWGYEV